MVHGSFATEALPNAAPAAKHHSIGVDAGARHLATLCDGTTFENPRALARYARDLRRNQQGLARQCKGSNRRARTHRRVTRTGVRP